MISVGAEQLIDHIRERSVTVGIVGLGYVGLPLAVTFAEAGFATIGFDVQSSIVDALGNGRCHLRHVDATAVGRVINSGRLTATTAMARLGEPDVIVVCVPTPLSEDLTPDLKHVAAAINEVSLRLRYGQLVVLESTTYPGTLVEVVQPILQSSGLEVGRDVWLAYVPERVDPGNASYPTQHITRVVGADDQASLSIAHRLYEAIAPRVHLMESSRAAEAVKLTENVFRAVNVALVNELKLVFDAIGIDIWEVIEGAATKPFGFMQFSPGPGVGGHCIPVDPHYLGWAAERVGVRARLVEVACMVNADAPARVVDVLLRSLSRSEPIGLKGMRILIVGVSYKRDVEDIRDSPALHIMDIIERGGGMADYHDPLVEALPAHAGLASRFVGRRSVAWSRKALSAYDAVIVATDHSAIDYVELAGVAKLVVDTRNACTRAGADLTRVVKA